MSDSLVIIPTYNEKENIVKMIDTVMALPDAFDILVVDDGSPDGTGQLVLDAQKSHPGRIHLLQRSGKQGLGTAYIAGFNWALALEYQYIFEMDADFSHNPNDLIRLKNACLNGADIGIGSRYVKDGGVLNWPINRMIISKGASFYTQTVLGFKVKDSTSGFICYHRRVLEAIDLESIEFIGYAFQVEMKFKADRLGFKLQEVPILFKDREEGTSKMSISIFSEAFFGVWKMRFSNQKK